MYFIKYQLNFMYLHVLNVFQNKTLKKITDTENIMNELQQCIYIFFFFTLTYLKCPSFNRLSMST